MSRPGYCWDNTVAESFFSSLKKDRIRKRIYKTRELAKAEIFDCTERLTIEPVATATSVTSAPRRLKVPQPGVWTCLNIAHKPQQAKPLKVHC